VVSRHFKGFSCPDVLRFHQENLLEIVNEEFTLHSNEFLVGNSFQVVTYLKTYIFTEQHRVILHQITFSLLCWDQSFIIVAKSTSEIFLFTHAKVVLDQLANT